MLATILLQVFCVMVSHPEIKIQLSVRLQNLMSWKKMHCLIYIRQVYSKLKSAHTVPSEIGQFILFIFFTVD